MAKPKYPTDCSWCCIEPGHTPLINDGSHQHQCPTCGHEVFYNGKMDRYFHVSGANNRPCWNGLDDWMKPPKELS